MSISLLEKLAGKPEEFEVDYNNIKIVFRTLSQKEYDEILALNPRTDLAGLEELSSKLNFTYNAISDKEKVKRKNRNSLIEIYLN